MKRKALALFLVCLFVVSIGLTGCAPQAAEPSAPAAGDTIKVGWMGSLTGDQAVWGSVS